MYSLWAYLSLSNRGVPAVDDSKRSGDHSRFAMLIALTAISMIKAIVDLLFFCYSVKVVHALVRQLQPSPTVFPLLVRVCGYFVAALLFFTGVVMRDIMSYGISQWAATEDSDSMESALTLMEAIEQTVTVYLVYAFAFSVLAVLYHFGSIAEAGARNPNYQQ